MFLHKTTCSPAEWQWTGKRRVLVESAEAWAVAPALEAAGYEVALCHGPLPGERCPLLAQGRCATAAAAHAIVSDLPADDGPAIVAALHATFPGTPIVEKPTTVDQLLESLQSRLG